MSTITYRGITPTPEIHLKRKIDISAADFDGSATASIADATKVKNENGSYSNPWSRGFLLQPVDTDGVVYALMWGDYVANGKTVDDTLKQAVNLTVGQWANERVIKVYSDSAADTDLYIGI